MDFLRTAFLDIQTLASSILSWKSSFLALVAAILLRWLFNAVVRDALLGQKLSYCLIKNLSWISRFTESPWSGKWRVTWNVRSSSFQSQNGADSDIYRLFSSVVFKSSGQTKTGITIDYAFIGKLSSDQNILTGLWFDYGGGRSGYHGSFQLSLNGTRDLASGLWLGFSRSSNTVKSDKLELSKPPL